MLGVEVSFRLYPALTCSREAVTHQALEIAVLRQNSLCAMIPLGIVTLTQRRHDDAFGCAGVYKWCVTFLLHQPSLYDQAVGDPLLRVAKRRTKN